MDKKTIHNINNISAFPKDNSKKVLLCKDIIYIPWEDREINQETMKKFAFQ